MDNIMDNYIPVITVSEPYMRGHWRAVIEDEYEAESYMGSGLTAMEAVTDLIERDSRKSFIVRIEE